MSTPANVVTFYAQAHWGSPWGVVDYAHPTPHKGLDCGLFHGTIDVPALHDGTVVAAAASSSVGHYVTVQRADKLFDTYCHIVLGVKVGQAVKQGDRLGRQAVTKAEGGSAWLGQHTHLCLSRTQAGWASWTAQNLDPTPGVIAVLTNTAGSDGKPIDNETTTRSYTVTTNYVLEGTGDATGAKNSTWAIAGDAGIPCPGNWIEFSRSVYDNSDPKDQGARAAAAHGNPIVLAKADWDARKAAYTTPAPAGSLTIDPKVLQPLIDAVNAQGTAVKAAILNPTTTAPAAAPK